MTTFRKISPLSKLLIPTFILICIVQQSTCLGPQYTPKTMDYELRRPITYLYNRLAYKYDFNPYTSHLLDTQSHCSSRTGPFCGFTNNRDLMDRRMPMQTADQQIHAVLVASVGSNRDAAFQIQKGLLDAFLISGDYSKKFDQSVKKFIASDFYAQVPTHHRLPKNNLHITSNRRANKKQFTFVYN